MDDQRISEMQAEDILLRQRIESLRSMLRGARSSAVRALEALGDGDTVAARVFLEKVPGRIEDALLADDDRAGHVF